MKNNGDIIQFVKQKDYIMVNNNLGNGSFGKTVLLQDPFIGELFVAKKYEPEYEAIKEKFYKNFLDEIKILHKLNHKNIVRVYNYYAYENIYTGYILMEYIDGKDIGAYISNYFEPFEDITLDDIFSQLIDAFCYIESNGIAHRDIREGNILISNTGIVKVIDFGIGKTFAKAFEEKDSLVAEINRDGSDTLPQEYYDGIYTFQTDMFYLAELLSRLMRNAEDVEDSNFTYHHILDKMMQKKPENRYASFFEVKTAIEKHDFLDMDISEADKTTYRAFAELVFNSVLSFTDTQEFNHEIDVFVRKLEVALKANLFEEEIQNNDDVIGCVVTGAYQYDNSVNIPCSVVKSFLEWFKKATPESQKIIIANIISKLSIIKTVESEPELPF